MGYSNYKKIKTVAKKFNLTTQRERLFGNVIPIEPSAWLVEALQYMDFLPLTNEKSKSERIISPILIQIAKAYQDKVSFFSGEDLNVKPEDDLAGECDFFFALHPKKVYLETPIISLAEAKDENMEWGVAQCAAQLYGAKLFNEMEGHDIPILYGCATDGIEWQFIRFENNTFYIDNKIYTDLQNNTFYIDNKIYTDLREILGMWHTIIQLYVGSPTE